MPRTIPARRSCPCRGSLGKDVIGDGATTRATGTDSQIPKERDHRTGRWQRLWRARRSCPTQPRLADELGLAIFPLFFPPDSVFALRIRISSSRDRLPASLLGDFPADMVVAAALCRRAVFVFACRAHTPAERRGYKMRFCALTADGGRRRSCGRRLRRRGRRGGPPVC